MVWGRNTVMPMKAVHPHPREKADDESVQIDEYVADLHKNFSKLIICQETFITKFVVSKEKL